MIGILLILAALILINCSDAAAKLVIGEVPVFQVALVQAVAMVFAVPFVARTTRIRRLVATRRPWLQLLRSACQFASALCYFSGLALLPLPNIIAIIMVGPLMVTALAALVLKERVGLRRWVACAIGFAGALLVSGGHRYVGRLDHPGRVHRAAADAFAARTHLAGITP